MTTPTSAWASLDERKAAIRGVLADLATAAEAAGLPSVARDVRETRLPKLDDERFTIVVLGEFNHGKSTFINALLGGPVLPTGITPTTAVLAHISQGAKVGATLVMDSGERKAIDVKKLGEWLTVEGLAGKSTAGEGIHHVELTHPSGILDERVTIVDTPGVNDINEQRADITYGYLPRADAAVFLLDATQILSASERQFLEERILRSSRDRLLFVVAKADLLDAAELEETLAFARKHLAAIVAEPVVLPVSAKRALAGEGAVAGGAHAGKKEDASGMQVVIAELGATVANERRRLLLDNALGDATRLAAFVRQSLAIRRKSLELPMDELESRIARAKDKLRSGQKALETAAETIRAETSALKARVRQDLADFTAEFRARLPTDIDAVEGPDVQKYLSFFVQDTWKAWTEAEGELVAAELDRLAEQIIQVTNENIREVAQSVSGELGPSDTKVPIVVDTLKYDASVFALGALGTTVFLFVNSMVGGALALSAPVLALILKGRVSAEIKAEAREQAPRAVDRVAALVGPKLDELVDGFGARLLEFVAQAGDTLGRGIAEVLDRARDERQARGATSDAGAGVAGVDAAVKNVRALDERIADIRQRVWASPSDGEGVGAGDGP